MKKGYLLTDALIAVFITAMIALVTSAALPAAGNTKTVICHAITQAEEAYEQGIRMIPECVLCSEEESEETAEPE